MGKWIKYFADGSFYTGTDEDIDKGIASWSKSPLDNIISVTLEHNKERISVHGAGEYWQSDTYESIFPGPNSTLIRRCIEKRITPHDRCFAVLFANDSTSVFFNQEHQTTIGIPEEWHYKWFILELDIMKKKTTSYVRDNRL